MSAVKGLKERLQAGEDIMVAEGYLFAFERRGYLKAGAYVPEVVLEHPELVRSLYEEFVHAGSDVVLAFTYYGHREKLRLIGREADLEPLNRKSLKLAREVADVTGILMAGNICNTTVWLPDNQKQDEKVYSIFKEQIVWAVEEGADFIVAETFTDYGEAKLALQAIKDNAKGLPSVVTLHPNGDGKTGDGLQIEEACRLLEEEGADVVGLNCLFGPDTILPFIKRVRNACKGPVACLPVPFRTTEEHPAMQDLTDQITGERAFPSDLDAWLCSRSHIKQFTLQLKAIGVQYMGLCCGNSAAATRSMAEALGRCPPASRFTADMSQHMSRVQGPEHTHIHKQWHQQHDHHVLAEK